MAVHVTIVIDESSVPISYQNSSVPISYQNSSVPTSYQNSSVPLLRTLDIRPRFSIMTTCLFLNLHLIISRSRY